MRAKSSQRSSVSYLLCYVQPPLSSHWSPAITEYHMSLNPFFQGCWKPGIRNMSLSMLINFNFFFFFDLTPQNWGLCFTALADYRQWYFSDCQPERHLDSVIVTGHARRKEKERNSSRPLITSVVPIKWCQYFVCGCGQWRQHPHPAREVWGDVCLLFAVFLD